MNSMLQLDSLPDPPGIPKVAKYSDLAQAVLKLSAWTRENTRYLQAKFQSITAQLNSQVQGVGTAIASAASITVSSPIHHVTGVATINAITPPAGFSGPIWLIADGAFSITTGGNIALARGPYTVGQVVMLVYDPATALFYPA